MRPIIYSLFFLYLFSLTGPAALADGPTVGPDAVASWKNPATTTNGTALKNLAGIKMWIGTSSHVFTKQHNAGLVSSLPLSVLNLPDGQYYIAVQAVDSNGLVSGMSNEVAFVLQAGNPTTPTSDTTNPTGGTTNTTGGTADSTGSTSNSTDSTTNTTGGTTGSTGSTSNSTDSTTNTTGGTTGSTGSTSNSTDSTTNATGGTTGSTGNTMPPPVTTPPAPSKPSITMITPDLGLPGTLIRIVGSNFTGATAVLFNGISSEFIVMNDGLIRATVPDGATTGPVWITTPYQTVSSGFNFTLPPPVLTRFRPQLGLPGDRVTIVGKYFTGATKVTFNGKPAAFTVRSNNVIYATVPVGATTGPISVTTPYDTAKSGPDFTLPPPSLRTSVPKQGAPGKQVTLIGKFLSGATKVTFNGISAPFTVVNSRFIHATVPDGASTGPIAVTTPYDTATTGFDFAILD